MKITIRSPREQELMIQAGNKLGEIFDRLLPEIRPGRSTWEIDKLADRFIRESGGVPNFSLEDG